MKKFKISSLDITKKQEFQHIINTKTKPLGSLGLIEKIGLQLCLIQNSKTPKIENPQIFVFAADHGIASEGVSPFPQEVTAQMIYNFMAGGGAINVFCNQNNINLTIINAGTKHIDLSKIDTKGNFINESQGLGTQNFLYQPAMTEIQFENCLEKGAEILQKNVDKTATNTVGFGEMGIGNTSAAAMIMHFLTKIDLQDCIGRGTGLNDTQLSYKYKILQKSKENYQQNYATISPIPYFCGFEIAMIAGAMLQAAQNKQVILIDGFIATAAFLIAHNICPQVMEYAIFCHQSDENGHKFVLQFLHAEPILKLNMRLGEGTGCAMALPIVQASANFITSMASFDQANVANKVI